MLYTWLHIRIKKSSIQKNLVMSINSRTKGATYERQVVGILNEFFSQNNFAVSCKRNLDQYQEKDLPDINIPFHAIECKHYKSGNSYKPEWWQQVCKSAEIDKSIPVLIYKFNRVPTKVCLPLHAINTKWPKDNEKVAILSMNAWLDILKTNWEDYRGLYGSNL